MKASDRIRRCIAAIDNATAGDDDSPLCLGLIAEARALLVRARDENAYEERQGTPAEFVGFVTSDHNQVEG